MINETAAQEVWQAIGRAKRILLHLHPRPDPDSVGSALALRQALLSVEKAVTLVAGDTPVPAYLATLPGASEIIPKRVSELDLNQFDLFIILDSGGWERVSEHSPLSIPTGLDTVVIDHHQTTKPFGRLNLLFPQAAATAEILFELFRLWRLPLTREIAVCLLVGLHGDTGHFVYSNAQAQTFAAAAELMKLAPDFYLVIDEMENQQLFSRLALHALGVLAAKPYRHGSAWVATLSLADLRARQLAPEAGIASFIASSLKSIKGCKLALALVEEEPGQIKVSARRRGSSAVDVSLLVERLGGGGHAAAAGATIGGSSVAEAEARILSLIDELYPDL